MLGIFSIGFVNASPLIPASASLNKFSSNYVTQQGNVKDTNDSNEVTYFGFLGGDHSNPFGNFEIIYNFSSMKDINNISYKRKFYAESTIVTAHTESISIFADGIWVNIYSNQNYNLCDGWTGICAECWGLYPDNCGAGSCVCTILPPVFFFFLNLEWKNITGNWKNVTAVKFSANYQVNDPSMENNGVIYYYLYEFQSFGVDSVPPVTCPDGFCNPATETCLNCPADCGTCPDVCLTPDDAIIKLSNSTNARGALWNDTNFIHDVCYSDIFGAVYSGANPHSCTGSNKILGLSDIADARAEIPSLNNYLTDVCYGDLDCISETGAGQCSDAARKVVARLSNQTNANLEQASNNNYNTKICCKSGVVPAGNIYWADMEETMINNVDLNALVKLMITGLSGGENIDCNKKETRITGN